MGQMNNNQGRNGVGKGVTIPLAPSNYGGAEKS